MAASRIAIISPFQFRLKRGIERVHWSLATEFARRGVAVDMLTWSHPHPADWGPTPAGVRIRRVPYFRYCMGQWASLFYRWWLRRERYDWAIVAFAGYGEAAALRRNVSTRTCVVLHYPAEQVPHRYEEFKASGLAGQAALCVGVSQFTARGAESFFGRRCAVVPNGVDTSAFRPSPALRSEMRARLGLSPDAQVIITTAALEERKGIQHVIRAMSELEKVVPDPHYLVLGEGPYRVELERLVHDLGLSGRVHLVGAVDDVIPYLAMADAGCLLSYGEAFGITAIEYMAMELPCITSQHPPFPEIVIPDCGMMVDEAYPAQLTQALHELLTDRDKQRTMGQAGRAHVMKHFDWGRISETYLQLMREAEGR